MDGLLLFRPPMDEPIASVRLKALWRWVNRDVTEMKPATFCPGRHSSIFLLADSANFGGNHSNIVAMKSPTITIYARMVPRNRTIPRLVSECPSQTNHQLGP